MASDCSPLQTSSWGYWLKTNQLSILFLTDKSIIETLIQIFGGLYKVQSPSSLEKSKLIVYEATLFFWCTYGMKLLFPLRSWYAENNATIHTSCLSIVCLSSLHCSRIFYSLREGGISHVSVARLWHGGWAHTLEKQHCKNRTYWQNKVQLPHARDVSDLYFCNLSWCVER